MPDQEYQFVGDDPLVDTVARLWDTGKVTIPGSADTILADILPTGWRTLVQLDLLCQSPWEFAGESGVLVPGPVDVWIRLTAVNSYRTFQAEAGGSPDLFYVIQGK